MAEIISIEFHSAAIDPERVQVHSLRGTEALGLPFEFHIELQTADYDGIDEGAVLTQPGEIRFLRAGVVERSVFGIVNAVRSSLTTESRHRTYRLRFVPRFANLALHLDSEVFLDKSIPDIIQAKLEGFGMVMGDDFEFRLMGSYVPRDFVVQYRETDLAFVSRLAEHWGMTLSFEHATGRDVAVFTDDNSSFLVLNGQPTASFRGRGEHRSVFRVDSVMETLTGSYVIDDYNYRTPSVVLRTGAAVPQGTVGAVIEHGTHCKTPDEAELIATIRSQEVGCERQVFEGASDLTLFSAGARTTLEDHPLVQGQWLITRVEHVIEQPVFGRGRADQQPYQNTFAAIDSGTPFRPRRRTPKPHVFGAITGVVEAEQAGQYAEMDGDGRYHVRFKFDAGSAPRGQASKLVRMAQPHAGAGFGFHFPLRDGVEVLLTCIDGDPDRPIITGAVPNPQTPSVVGSGNGTRNVIRTGGGNEINMDDTEGATRIKMTVPRSNTVFQLGAPNHDGDGCVIGTDKQMLVETGTTVSITAGSTMALNANPSITATAPTVDLEGATTVIAHGKTVALNGDTIVTATAPTVSLEGKSVITEHAPMIAITADAMLGASAPILTASADALATVFGKGMASLLSQGISIVSSSGVVSVMAPTIVISGGNVTINGDASVTIKGGKIDLNP